MFTGAAAVCLPIMALPMTRALAARCVSACVQETAVVREALLGQPAFRFTGTTMANPADRRMAPDFALTDSSGARVKLSDFRGKVVLLNFWATWCRPCAEEIPWFMEFAQANKARGFEVMGVSMDDSGWGAVRPYIEVMKLNYTVMVGDAKVAGLYGGLSALPMTLIIDRAGRVAVVHEGLSKREQYESEIDAVLKER